MMSLRSVSALNGGLTVVRGDGVTWSITGAEIDAIYATKTGPEVQRLSQTLTDVLDSMVSVLGSDRVDKSLVDIEINPTTRRVTSVTIRST